MRRICALWMLGLSLLPLPAAATVISAQRLRADTPDATPGDGTCANQAGECSLRAAIQEANALPGRDQIYLSNAGRDEGYAGLLDEVVITEDLDIYGMGAKETRVLGAHLRRLLQIPAGVDVTIKDITLSSGLADDGGIIKNAGTLLLERAQITSGFAKRGGGVFNTGTLTARDSFFFANVGQAPSPSGGSIYNAGTVVLNRVSIAKSQAVVGCGGGLFNDAGATAQITNSTLARNGARKGTGGAICNSGGTVECTNCTILKNRSTDGGGGLLNRGGTIRIVNTVLADNTAAALASNCDGDPVLSLGHNLDDGSTCGLSATGDRSGVDPQLRSLEVDYDGYSPIVPLKLSTSPLVDAGDDSACPAVDQRGWPRPFGASCDIGATENQPPVPTPSYTATPHDITPSTTPTRTSTRTPTNSPVPSSTISPQPSAPPTNSRTPVSTATETVPRTETATRTETPTRTQTITRTASNTPTMTPLPTDTPTPYPAEDFVVSVSALDAPDASPGDGTCATTKGDCTLRAAVEEADAGSVPRTIHLPVGVTKIHGDLVVNNHVTLAGDSMYGSDINAGSNSRVFHVMSSGTLTVRDAMLSNGEADDGGVVLNEGTLVMDRSVLRSGKAQRGAGLLNAGTATLTDVFFNGHTDRPPAGLGGCIHNRGLLTLNRVTLKRGQARLGCGGGIYNEASGMIDAVNLTVMRNRARRAVSGGICNEGGVMRCVNCTIARNQANHAAGGILNVGGTIELANTILSLNWQAHYGRLANCAGDPVISLGHNLDDGDTCNLTGPGDISAVDPEVRVVQFYPGGRIPVGAFKTNLSPAINAGDPSMCPDVDAMGQRRPVGGACDIGAYEEPF